MKFRASVERLRVQKGLSVSIMGVAIHHSLEGCRADRNEARERVGLMSMMKSEDLFVNTNREFF